MESWLALPVCLVALGEVDLLWKAWSIAGKPEPRECQESAFRLFKAADIIPGCEIQQTCRQLCSWIFSWGSLLHFISISALRSPLQREFAYLHLKSPLTHLYLFITFSLSELYVFFFGGGSYLLPEYISREGHCCLILVVSPITREAPWT